MVSIMLNVATFVVVSPIVVAVSPDSICIPAAIIVSPIRRKREYDVKFIVELPVVIPIRLSAIVRVRRRISSQVFSALSCVQVGGV